MGHWQVGPVNSYINIYPGWEAIQEKSWINVSHQRRRNGSLKSYQEAGDFDKFEMPLSWVSSSDRALINSWAGNITDLRLISDSDYGLFSPVPSMTNGDLETGDTTGWTFFVNSTGSSADASFAVSSASPYEGNYDGLVAITDGGSVDADIQLVLGSPHTITDGKKYMVRLAVIGVASRTILAKVEKNGSPFTNYGLNETISVSSVYQIIELPFTGNTDAADARLNFHLGGDTNNVNLDIVEYSPGSFYDVRITNTQEPLTSAVKPYDNFYQGEVVFETI